MATEIFNRYENKYLLNCETFVKLQNRIADYMELDEYNKKHELYPIANIYYDTEDSHLIRTSISKPKYKEKLRIRSYGQSNSGDNVYVEIKKKVMGLTNKRRTAMTLEQATSFLETGTPPAVASGMNAQVIREIEYILQQHTLVPMLYLAYDRRAFFGVGQHDLRLSFDTNIRSRRSDLDLAHEIYGKPLLPNDMWLMEVKTRQSIPIWLANLLSEYKVYPTSFSKYGTEYKAYVADSIRTFPAPDSTVFKVRIPTIVPERIATIGGVKYA